MNRTIRVFIGTTSSTGTEVEFDSTDTAPINKWVFVAVNKQGANISL